MFNPIPVHAPMEINDNKGTYAFQMIISYTKRSVLPESATSAIIDLPKLHQGLLKG